MKFTKLILENEQSENVTQNSEEKTVKLGITNTLNLLAYTLSHAKQTTQVKQVDKQSQDQSQGQGVQVQGDKQDQVQ